jgi:pimeloyl-ACP methyl ester carboxylesterase
VRPSLTLALVAVVVLSTTGCGGDNGSANDVSEPMIDERFTVGSERKQVALVCFGEGSPLVFLEPGDDASGIEEFTTVRLLRPLAEEGTACTYDRLGAGGSDPPSESRRTLDDTVRVLHGLVEQADLAVPFVHVGVSGGGYIALYYASRYPDDVAGVVLLDVAHEDPKEGAKLFPGAKAWNNPEHVDNVDAVRRVVHLPPLAFSDTPLRVITASEGPSSAEENQSAWLKHSSDAQQTTLAGGHNLSEENPDGVVAEIRKLLDAVDE